MITKSRKLSEEKNPPRAQIFRHFRIESRYNKLELNASVSLKFFNTRQKN